MAGFLLKALTTRGDERQLSTSSTRALMWVDEFKRHGAQAVQIKYDGRQIDERELEQWPAKV